MPKASGEHWGERGCTPASSLTEPGRHYRAERMTGTTRMPVILSTNLLNGAMEVLPVSPFPLVSLGSCDVNDRMLVLGSGAWGLVCVDVL